LSQKSSNETTAPQHTATLIGENETKMLDNHHTHFLLLDDGSLNRYLNDDPRSKFVETTHNKTGCHAVTIIVEGGVNTLEVIQNDLRAQRPVVIVHGSGRLASVLGNLLEIAGKTGSIG
jgi:transient receptor potential cation channel subfamily M protein 2